jgi:glucans biosynthesis protein
VDLLYPGFIFDVPVNINLVVGRTARRVLFTNERFAYAPEVPLVTGAEDYTGYSGFRVRARLNTPDQFDEFLIFQGATYFRAVAKDQAYGLSARGLAVRTARPEGEEFPVFTDFFIERPPEAAEQIVIHALLQSPSAVGAYTFTARPGEETTVDVHLKLFPRADLTAFGIAPLTSMFLFDASNRARFDDYRNAVHDSDGLQILNGRGERLWRPLANPLGHILPFHEGGGFFDDLGQFSVGHTRFSFIEALTLGGFHLRGKFGIGCENNGDAIWIIEQPCLDKFLEITRIRGKLVA